MIYLNNELLEFKQFNDGSCRANIEVRQYSPQTIKWLYDSEIEFMYLFYLTNHLRANGIKDIVLDVPYLCGARMDRTKRSSEVFTLKYACDFINALNFYRIYIYDPHSYVTPALLNNVTIENPSEEIAYLLKKYPSALMFYPDEGSMKRLHSYFEVPYAFGCKERNWETQKVESLHIMGAKHMIAGHDIIMCDDILSRGSTAYMAAKQLKDLGANNIYMWVSHCENTVLGPHLNGQSLLDIPNLITKVYTTNSIFRANHPKIEVIKRFIYDYN